MAHKRISTSLNCRLNFEALESRQLLSVTVNVASRSMGTGEPVGSTTNYGDYAPQAISADGRYVVFLSSAANIVEGFTPLPAVDNVYRFDRLTGEVALVSVSADGPGGANSGSKQPQISADGNVIAFSSYASNLHPGDNNSTYDIFARDMSAGITHLVSVDMLGAHSGNGRSQLPSLSADGTVVVFRSQSTNLDPLDSDQYWDIYVRHLGLQRTQLVSVNATGTGTGNEDNFTISPATLSADGRVVVYSSTASNLHPLDTDAEEDVFARELETGVTHLVSINADETVSANGRSWIPDISADGTKIAFMSNALDLDPLDVDRGGPEDDVDIFVRDLVAGTTHLVSVNWAGTGSGDGASTSPAISADGNVVAFESGARDLTSLVLEDAPTSIYARNLTTGTTYLVSINMDGTGGGDNEGSFHPRLSADGQVIVFMSGDTNLDPLDTDDDADVYARDLAANKTYLVSGGNDGTEKANDRSFGPVLISADGRQIVFASAASNLVPNDFNSTEDVFVATLLLGEPPLPGDYNTDTVVDASDYTVWRNAVGQTGLAAYSGADGNGDGKITLLDYDVWKSHYGQTAPEIGSGVGGSIEVITLTANNLESVESEVSALGILTETPGGDLGRSIAFLARSGMAHIARATPLTPCPSPKGRGELARSAARLALSQVHRVHELFDMRRTVECEVAHETFAVESDASHEPFDAAFDLLAAAI